MERSGNGWAPPQNVRACEHAGNEWYPTIAQDGTIASFVSV